LFPVLILLIHIIPSLSLLFYYGLISFHVPILDCKRDYSYNSGGNFTRLSFLDDRDFFYNLTSFKYLQIKLRKLGRLEMFQRLL